MGVSPVSVMPSVSTRELWNERLAIHEVSYYWNNYVPLALSPLPDDTRPSLGDVRTELEKMLTPLPEPIREWLHVHWEECVKAYGPKRDAFVDYFRKQRAQPERNLDINSLYADWASTHEPTRFDEFVLLLQRRLEEIDTAFIQNPSRSFEGPRGVTVFR